MFSYQRRITACKCDIVGESSEACATAGNHLKSGIFKISWVRLYKMTSFMCTPQLAKLNSVLFLNAAVPGVLRLLGSENGMPIKYVSRFYFICYFCPY